MPKVLKGSKYIYSFICKYSIMPSLIDLKLRMYVTLALIFGLGFAIIYGKKKKYLDVFVLYKQK